jgi:hypothetical protein
MQGFVYVYHRTTLGTVQRSELGFQFRHFLWVQAADKVLFSEKLKESDESPMPSFAREVVKLGIPLTITRVHELDLTPRTGHAFW